MSRRARVIWANRQAITQRLETSAIPGPANQAASLPSISRGSPIA